MYKLFFLQKRNIKKNNEYIMFSSYRMSLQFTKTIINKIKDNFYYKNLIIKYNKELIELYFKKKIFYELLQITNQIVINDYNKNNNLKIGVIDLSSISSTYIVEILLKENLINYKTNKNYYLTKKKIKNILKKIISLKKKIADFLLFIKIKNLLSKNITNINSDDLSNIGIYYAEGLIESKKSDLFWFDKDLFIAKNVIIYVDDLSLLNKHQHYLKNLEYINKNNFKLIYIKPYLRNKSITENKSNNLQDVDKWILKISNDLSTNIKNWSNFFYLNNIKIHFDPTEYGLDTIIKQIALDKLGGCSIGKLRSYPSELDGKFLGYYSNDIFFTWGSDSTNYLVKSENYINNYVISGFPYKLNNFTKKTVNKIKNQFINQGVKFTILILDTNHSDNKSHYFQYIPTSILINFYKQIINLLNIDNEIGVIIKSKKNIISESDKNLNRILKNAKKTSRFHFVENPFQTLPVYYANISDITIGIGTFISSALMECVYQSNKCIYYDYANNLNNIKNLYDKGFQKFIFNDLEEIIEKITNYKKNKDKNLDFGDWKKVIDNIRSFEDLNGNKRISEYLKNLKSRLDQGDEKKDAIQITNQIYKNKYGRNKIFTK